MSRPTKTIEAPPPDSLLETYLLKLRNDEQQAITIVEYLEDNSCSTGKYDLKYGKSYVIKLIQTYCETVEPTCKKDKYSVVGTASDKSELLLAACGLLQKFEFKPREQEQRIVDYRAYVRDNNWYNKLLIGDWSHSSVATKVREILANITKELATKVESAKSKNKGKLGFHDEVPEKLYLPAPRGNNEPEKSLITKLSSFVKQLIPALSSIKAGRFFSLSHLNTLFMAIIALAMIKLVFFQTTSSHRPETTDRPSASSVPVEEISCEKPVVQVYPGQTVQLPLKISPDEAVGTFLCCSSSNSDILYTEDDTKAWVTALEISDPEVSTANVTVTVTPQDRISSDVFVEVPVTVNYKIPGHGSSD